MPRAEASSSGASYAARQRSFIDMPRLMRGAAPAAVTISAIDMRARYADMPLITRTLERRKIAITIFIIIVR